MSASDEVKATEEEELAAIAQLPIAEIPHIPKDPRTKARWNIFSRLLFIWVDPLLWLGWRRGLTQEDLYKHPLETDAKRLLEKFNVYWARELERKEHGGTARLWLVIIKCIWLRLLAQGVLMFLEVGFQVGQSIVLGYLANYFTITNPTPEDTRDAYLYAAGLVAMALTVTLMHGHGFILGQKTGMIARITCSSAIYQKILRLGQVTLGKVSTGHIINLMSNDVQRFDQAFLFIHFLWISPLHLTVFTYLVYREVGWPAFLAMAFVILQVPLQIFLARIFGKLRFKSAQVTDKRVRVMNEVITGIRVIKMYAWEYAFRRVVTTLRKDEATIISQSSIVQATLINYRRSTTHFLAFIIFIPFIYAMGAIPLVSYFTILSLVNSLCRTSFNFYSRIIFQAFEAQVVISRIQV